MLVDTHCHLTDPAFDDDRDAVTARMRAAGVDRALVIESVLGRLDGSCGLVARDDRLRIATGCHPHDASQWSQEMADQLDSAWRRPMVRAVGEIGLDYHYNHSVPAVQRDVFARQLASAVALGLPVVIHARQADDDVVAVLREQPAATVVLHSFTSGATLRDAGLDRGWYFSFSGMVTFKSWPHTDTVRAVPESRLLVETDAPYLAPVPHRGKRNEPAFVVEVARRVAELRGTDPGAIAAVTSANAERLFWNQRSDTASIGV